MKFCGPLLPPPLPGFEKRSIRDFLDKALRPIDRSTMTACMQANLLAIEKKIPGDLAAGKLHEGDVVCAAVDRAANKAYPQRYYKRPLPSAHGEQQVLDGHQRGRAQAG